MARNVRDTSSSSLAAAYMAACKRLLDTGRPVRVERFDGIPLRFMGGRSLDRPWRGLTYRIRTAAVEGRAISPEERAVAAIYRSVVNPPVMRREDGTTWVALSREDLDIARSYYRLPLSRLLDEIRRYARDTARQR